jgi:SAM-dependent methyltransferase
MDDGGGNGMSREQRAAVVFTGERMIPESTPASTFWEHLYRYKFAARFVDGLSVLDVACGEGYGAAGLLRAGARHVLGVDIASEACSLAADRYDFPCIRASADAIPLAACSVDLVVSFETIEHLNSPNLLVAECARVLKPGGKLIISTPNRAVVERMRSTPNPFHPSELDEQGFSEVLSSRFRIQRMYCQVPVRISRWSRYALMDDESPWLHRHGVWRLREALRRRVDHNVWQEPQASLRRTLPDAVRQHVGLASSLVNPYAVHPYEGSSEEEPMYFVAVAESDTGAAA